MRYFIISRLSASPPVQILLNNPLKYLVPVLEKLLKDDRLLPLRQDLHLQHKHILQLNERRHHTQCAGKS